MTKKKTSNKKRGYGSGQKRRNISLDDERVEKLKKIGGGNLSEGIRVATDSHKKS